MKIGTIPSTIRKEVETYFEPMDILACILATGVLLFVSFVGYSTMTLTSIHLPMGTGVDAPVFITYYGFPLPMIGILTPVGGQQTSAALWNQILGNTNVRILWLGLFLNIAVFFVLSFLAVYLYRRFTQTRELSFRSDQQLTEE